MSSVSTCEKAHEGCFLYGYEPPEPLRGTQTHGCYKDRDHIVPRRSAIPEPNSPADRLFNDYIFRSPSNIRVVCRREHHQRNMIEQRENRLLFPVPSFDFMLRTLRQNLQDGLVVVPINKISKKIRDPESIMRDIKAVEAIDEAELLQRAAYHILEAQKSA